MLTVSALPARMYTTETTWNKTVSLLNSSINNWHILVILSQLPSLTCFSKQPRSACASYVNHSSSDITKSLVIPINLPHLLLSYEPLYLPYLNADIHSKPFLNTILQPQPATSNRNASSSSSRMHFMSHNWSATKQHLHLQSVAEISRHSVLSGDSIRQCETSSGSRHKNTDQCL